MNIEDRLAQLSPQQRALLARRLGQKAQAAAAPRMRGSTRSCTSAAMPPLHKDANRLWKK